MLKEAENKALVESELATKSNKKVPFLGRFSPHSFDFKPKKIEENLEFFSTLNHELKLYGYHIAITNINGIVNFKTNQKKILK
jgi:hypothetical protein